jgi:hypothetical protein
VAIWQRLFSLIKYFKLGWCAALPACCSHLRGKSKAWSNSEKHFSFPVFSLLLSFFSLFLPFYFTINAVVIELNFLSYLLFYCVLFLISVRVTGDENESCGSKLLRLRVNQAKLTESFFFFFWFP